MMLTIDRLVTALVCEDHMLQAWGWNKDVEKLGAEILKIYRNLFVEWNTRRDIQGIWGANALSVPGLIDSEYVIELIYSSSQGGT